MTSSAHSAGRINYNSYTSTSSAIVRLVRLFFIAVCQGSPAFAAPLLSFVEVQKKHDDHLDAEDPSLWLYLGIAAVLVLLGGAFAGLTIA